MKYLQKNVEDISGLRWVAQEGETPGWDIEYQTSDKRLIRIEVKSTQSQSIRSVEITANEWRAAKLYRARYRLALVASCLSTEPIIQFIVDPFGAFEKGNIELSPVRFQIAWNTLDHRR